MNPEELAVLLTTLRKFGVESYAYKELAITFRFPKQQESQACIVVSPQEQVAEFDATSDDPEDSDDDELEDVATVDVNPVPPAFRHLFKAVPKKSGKVE